MNSTPPTCATTTAVSTVIDNYVCSISGSSSKKPKTNNQNLIKR